jgi:hypothetical protein
MIREGVLMNPEQLHEAQDAMKARQQAKCGHEPVHGDGLCRRCYDREREKWASRDRGRQAERQRQLDLLKIKRKQRKLIAKLESDDFTASCSQGQISAMRLLADLYSEERNRLEGKPFTQPEPPKAPSQSDTRLSEEIKKLFAPAPEPSPAQPQGEQPN